MPLTQSNFIGFPYPITQHSHGYWHSQNGIAQIKSDILALLLTNQGERVMLSNFGCDLRRFIFEPNDSILQQQVQNAISQQITAYEPRVVIQSINVSAINGNNLGILNPADNLTETGSILFISITFLDPQNITTVQDLTLEIPLT